MFEKEAIIHAFEETIGIECLNKPVEDFTYEELSDELQEKAYDFKKGAEFGYNKCKEELNQKGLALQSDMDKTIEQNIALKKELNKVKEWHYAKDELPPLNTNVLVIHKWHRTPEVGKRITVFSNSSVWVWAMCCDRYRYTGEDKNVIAWKEITLPKKE